MPFRFDAPLWRWEATEASWCFVTVPPEISDEIDQRSGPRRGFGSVRVRVRIGGSTWTTSVFPDKGREADVLPVKAAIRTTERLSEGERATVHLELVDD